MDTSDSGSEPAADSNQAFQVLVPDEILAAVENLGFVCDGRLLALNSFENRVYRIGIEDDEPIVAKFYRPERWSKAAIIEEHDFALEVAGNDIPLVAPLVVDGQTLHRHLDFDVALFPHRGGHAPESDDFDQLQQIGRLIGRIHLVGEQKPFLHRPNVDVESYGVAQSQYLLQNQLIPTELEPAYSSLIEHLLESIRACFARAEPIRALRIHADLHRGNLLVRDDQVFIVDLDDTRSGPAIQDLWMFLSGERDEQEGQLEKLISGYREFRDFDLRELNLVEALRSLRLIHYSAWLAQRWSDPSFQLNFPWFGESRYWEGHILDLREQLGLLSEPPLSLLSNSWH